MSRRTHPYDFAFGAPEIEGALFPRIREEADTRAVDATNREQFVLLETVGDFMRSLLPPDARRAAVMQFGAIVHHAYHYWLAQKKTFEFDARALSAIVSPEMVAGDDPISPPAPAGYVQLPRNLVFARIEEAAPAEAADGFFFRHDDRHLDILLVLGLVPNRAGFSIVDVTAPVTEPFANAAARETGNDFENILPGGAGRLFALSNSQEVMKLAARSFWWIARNG